MCRLLLLLSCRQDLCCFFASLDPLTSIDEGPSSRCGRHAADNYDVNDHVNDHCCGPCLWRLEACCPQRPRQRPRQRTRQRPLLRTLPLEAGDLLSITTTSATTSTAVDPSSGGGRQAAHNDHVSDHCCEPFLWRRETCCTARPAPVGSGVPSDSRGRSARRCWRTGACSPGPSPATAPPCLQPTPREPSKRSR